MSGMLKLERCEVCTGKGWIKGIFHRMECAGCNGGGLIDPVTRKALEFPELIKQLRIRLERANHELAVLRPGPQPDIGAGRDYIRPNKRRHVGGGNYRGD